MWVLRGRAALHHLFILTDYRAGYHESMVMQMLVSKRHGYVRLVWRRGGLTLRLYVVHW